MRRFTEYGILHLNYLTDKKTLLANKVQQSLSLLLALLSPGLALAHPTWDCHAQHNHWSCKKSQAPKAQLPAANVEKLLGWITAPNSSLCCGYFVEPNLNPKQRTILPLRQAPAHVDADDAFLPLHKTWVFTGNVRISQPGRLVTANKGYVYPDKKTGKHKTATLVGNVHIREQAKLFVGTRAHLELNSQKGTLEDGIYRIRLNNKAEIKSKHPVVKVKGLSAWGRAKKITQLDKEHFRLQHTSYTTCSPSTNSWRLNSRKLNLNKITGRGIARDATLYVHGVPVFYTPYFDFPIDNRRQSGFLWPTFANTSLDGFTLNMPYYLNLAPNYDATITPRWMTKRGLQLNTEFRYLTKYHRGKLLLNYLPHDKAFRDFQNSIRNDLPNAPFAQRLLDDSDNRAAIHWTDSSRFNANWTAGTNVNWVSDDYYPQDLGGNLDLATNQYASNQLEQSGFLRYSNAHWSLNTLFQGYQTLHLINSSPVFSSYNKLPEITLHGNYPGIWHDLGFSMQAQYTDFQRNWIQEFEATPPVEGERFNLQPQFSMPMRSASGYVTPSVQLMLTHYKLRNQPQGNPNEISRALPIISLDSGLYFDRDTQLFNSSYTQTLEPRALFTYIPFRDQNQIPVFDSQPQTYYFNQIYNYNRFSGIDRVGDTKQVTLGLTTRLINNETGRQKFAASVGEIFYFGNQLVSSCGTPGCINTQNNPVNNKKITASAISSYTQYSISPDWNLIGTYSWDPELKRTNSGAARINYFRDQRHIVNFGYDFIYGYSPYPVLNGQQPAPPGSSRNNLNNINFSFVWPISPKKWLAIGTTERNISHGHLENYLLGVEYDTCCWAVRIMGGKSFRNFDPSGRPSFNKAIFLQWQLKGLGEIGNTQLNFLQRTIPNYQGQFAYN